MCVHVCGSFAVRRWRMVGEFENTQGVVDRDRCVQVKHTTRVASCRPAVGPHENGVFQPSLLERKRRDEPCVCCFGELCLFSWRRCALNVVTQTNRSDNTLPDWWFPVGRAFECACLVHYNNPPAQQPSFLFSSQMFEFGPCTSFCGPPLVVAPFTHVHVTSWCFLFVLCLCTYAGVFVFMCVLWQRWLAAAAVYICALGLPLCPLLSAASWLCAAFS